MSLILLLSPLTQSSLGTITGTASVNLDAVTVSAAGIGTAQGTLAVTTGAATLSAAGSPTPVTATLAQTLDTATVSAAGIGTALGTLAVTTGPATLSAAGSPPAATATLAQTLGTATVSAAGLIITGSTGNLAQTLDAATVVATGVGTVQASLSQTLDAATLSAQGIQTAQGTLATTLGAATLVGTGAPSPATATLAAYLAPIIFTSAGVLTTSPAAPTFGPILALANYTLITLSRSYVLIKATGTTVTPPASNNYAKTLLENAQALDTMVRVISKIIEDTVSTTDSLATGAAPKIDSVAVSTVGYGLMQDYVSGDYFAEDYVGSSFTF